MISFRFKQQISFMRSPHSIQPIYAKFTSNFMSENHFFFGPIFVNLYFTAFFCDNTRFNGEKSVWLCVAKQVSCPK